MLRIQLFIALLFLLCATSVNAQQLQIDSLKQQLAAAKADSVKITLAVQISQAYSNTNLDSMVHYSTQTINLLRNALATESEDSNKLQILWAISDMYHYVNNDSMVVNAERALLLCVKNKNLFAARSEVIALGKLADALWWAGNYPDAKATFFKALQIAESLNDTVQIASTYVGIAYVNRNAGDYRQAINYYTKAENLARRIGDNNTLMTVFVDKGKSYEQLGILDSAYTYLQEGMALQFRLTQGKNLYGGGAHACLGIIYSKMGKKELAEEFFRQSFQLSSEVNNIRILARSYTEFAEHFYRFHQPDSAIYYASKGLLIDMQFDLWVQQLNAATLLAKAYKQENKIDSAFKYQQLMIDTRDSVFGREKINRMQALEFNEQLRQQALALERSKEQDERRQNIQYALIAIGLVTFIILFLFLSRSFITSPKLITFFGVIALLLVFEFLNLLLHPFLERVTNHSPLLMLLALVCIAAILVPLHHKLEKWTTVRLVKVNKSTRLANAKKTIEKLESETDN